MSDPPERRERPHPSRRRYRTFVQDYKKRRLDEPQSETAKADPPKPDERKGGTRREYLRWLRPHRAAVIAIFVFALAVAGFEMAEPLFMRFIIDRVLQKPPRAVVAATATTNRMKGVTAVARRRPPRSPR